MRGGHAPAPPVSRILLPQVRHFGLPAGKDDPAVGETAQPGAGWSRAGRIAPSCGAGKSGHAAGEIRRRQPAGRSAGQSPRAPGAIRRGTLARTSALRHIRTQRPELLLSVRAREHLSGADAAPRWQLQSDRQPGVVRAVHRFRTPPGQQSRRLSAAADHRPLSGKGVRPPPGNAGLRQDPPSGTERA